MRFILKVFKDSWCLDSGLLGGAESISIMAYQHFFLFKVPH